MTARVSYKGFKGFMYFFEGSARVSYKAHSVRFRV